MGKGEPPTEWTVPSNRNGLQVASPAPYTVEEFICGNGQATKAAVAKVISSGFPEIKVYLTRDRVWKERHHQNMFDVMAVAVLGLAFLGRHGKK